MIACGALGLAIVACGDDATPPLLDARLTELVNGFEAGDDALEQRATRLLAQLDALVLSAEFDASANGLALDRLDEILQNEETSRLVRLELDCAAAALRGSPDLEVRALYYLGVEAGNQALFGRASTRIDARLPQLEIHAPRLLPLLHLERGTLARFESDWSDGRAWLRQAEAGLRAVEEPWAAAHLYTVYAEQFGMDLELGQTGRAAEWLAKQTQSVGEDNLDGRHGTELNSIKLAYFTQRYRRCVKLATTELERLESDRDVLGARHAGYFLRVRLLGAQARFQQLGSADGSDRSIEAVVETTLALDDLPWDVRSDALSLQALWSLRAGEHDLARAAVAELQERRPRAQQGGATSPLPACRLDALACLVARETGAPIDARRALLATWEASFTEFLQFWSAAPLEPDGVGFLQLGLRRFPLVEGIASAIQLARTDAERDAATERAFNYLLRAEAQGSLARRWGVAPPSLDAIRATLADGEGLLALVPGPQVSHVFLLDHKRLEHVTLPAERELIKRLEALSTGRPGTPDDERWQEPARRLAEVLLPEAVQARLREWTSIALVGTDLIGALPFAWLPLDDAAIGQTKPISNWPSIPLVVEMARRRKPARGSVALLAPQLTAIQNDTFGPLADVQATPAFLENLEQTHPKWDVHTSGAATAALFLGDLVAGTDLCFFLGHGVELRNELRPSALLLTPVDEFDLGLVRSRDIERAFGQKQNAPRVVILAACGTSQAPARFGDEGLGHLGGALIASGTKCVVLSSAALDRDATVLWTRFFHERYAAGSTVAEAVLYARRAMQRDARFTHPFFHSRIRALGLGSLRRSD